MSSSLSGYSKEDCIGVKLWGWIGAGGRHSGVRGTVGGAAFIISSSLSSLASCLSIFASCLAKEHSRRSNIVLISFNSDVTASCLWELSLSWCKRYKKVHGGYLNCYILNLLFSFLIDLRVLKSTYCKYFRILSAIFKRFCAFDHINIYNLRTTSGQIIHASIIIHNEQEASFGEYKLEQIYTKV